MILFEINNLKICCLDNPKCGSSTLRKWYKTLVKNKDVKILYKSKDPHGERFGYDNPNYLHCNLKGAVKLCRSIKINPNDVNFVCTIRHPIERYKSAYLYNNAFDNKNLFDEKSQTQKDDFSKYVYNEIHFQHFYPKKFRVFRHFKVNTIKLENLRKDFEKFLNELNIKLDCQMLDEKFNASKNELNIKLSNEIIEHITKKFALDYIDGNYSNDKYYQNSDINKTTIST
jgi:hypothetical protein